MKCTFNRGHPNFERMFPGSRFYLCVIALLLAAGAIGCDPRQEAAKPPPTDVDIVPVQQADVPILGRWVGTLVGYVNADIRAQVVGYLLSQDYQEGAFVHKGDLLFQIDPRPFKAALDQARGKLGQARAQLGKTELDVKRYTPLAANGAVSKEDLDNAVQANLSARADVSGPIFQGGRIYAEYLQAKAAWEEAKLEYQQTALIAFREVADALAARQKLEEVRVQQTQAVAADQEAVNISKERYANGKANYYEVLEAQQDLFGAQNLLAQTQRDQLLAIVQLYRALGGGWKPQ